MADSLDKQVEQLLQEGKSKQSIYTQLEKPDNRAKLIFFLNNKSLLPRRKKNMWINLILAAALLVMTLKRLLAISITGNFDFYLFFDFIVPTINFYILREILRFQRTGYQFLAVLTGLALFHQENRVFPDLFINLGLIALAVFLYYRMFPKEELLTLKT